MPFYQDAVFWIEVDKIKPNPFQPRRDFSEEELRSLSDSIRQYGILQALVVTRKEIQKEDGGLATEYELIAGESDLMKLELSIIENIQREDLNAVERARAFDKLAHEFGFKHHEIAKKVGKSREYVTNTVRLLTLPEDILNALSEGKITEGHTRPLMMLIDRPEERDTLFREIILKKMNVREAERIARTIAFERARKKDLMKDPALADMEEKLQDVLGTRVYIERREKGGKILIDFFDYEDLQDIVNLLKKEESALQKTTRPVDSNPPEEIKKSSSDEDLYSINNFSI